jgi:hypothetical protein
MSRLYSDAAATFEWRINTMKWTTIVAVLAVVFAGSVAWAGESNPPGFSVDFSNCTEFAGVGRWIRSIRG